MSEHPQKPQPPAVESLPALPPTVALEVPPVLVQIADRFMTLQESEHRLRSEEGARQLEETKMEINMEYQLRRDLIKEDRYRFTWMIVLVYVMVLATLGLSASLIFLKDDVKTGLLVLSHAVAIGGGILVGRTQKKPKSKPVNSGDDDDDD